MYQVILMILVMMLTNARLYNAVTVQHVLDLYEGGGGKHANNEIIREVFCGSSPIYTPGNISAVDNYKNPFRGVKWHIILRGCAPPAPPDKLSLMWPLMTRGYMPGTIKRLCLRDIPQGVKFNAIHFEGLEFVEYLNVHTACCSCPQHLNGDFMRPLTNVSWLSIENEALPTLPEKNLIKTALLAGGMSIGVWGGCEHLRALHLNNWRVPSDIKLGRGWMKNCKRLEYLKAEHMDQDSLQTVLASARYLLELQLQYNNLTAQKLANILRNATGVISLDVSCNNLTHIEGLDKQFSLRILNMSYNMVSNFGYALRHLKASKLGKLSLDHNPLHNYCDWYNVTMDIDGATTLPSLNELSLVGIGASKLCFTEWNSLRVLNLTGNNIEELQFGQLPLKKEYILTVDLRHNHLRRVHFNEKDYCALKKTCNISNDINLENNQAEGALLTVHTDLLPPFNCHCQNAWLARALRENLVALSAGAVCQEGEKMSAVPPASLECDLLPCAPCRCQRQWPGPSVAMNCEEFDFSDILQVPKQSNIGELHLRGNRIGTIRVEDLPDTLMLLDLRDNNVTRIDATHMAAQLKVINRRVFLGGNPIVCDCDSWPLLATLLKHREQVDYRNITCGSGGPSLYDVSKEQLCGVGMWHVLSIGGGLIMGITTLITALYVRYERQLRVWLYGHGWCLCCVREEVLDADREYDVFLSFAHGDHDFVASQLLPQLEVRTNGYKVCVHCRDWNPGELISTQIWRSVAASRRTVIVLSANFVQSMWGLMEFRVAHASALAERRVRLLVVALDDAPPIDQLPEELRQYLKITTYLSWNDPWFWKKFRYALPHRTSQWKKHEEAASIV